MKKNSIRERAKRVPKHIKAAVEYEHTSDKIYQNEYVTAYVIHAFMAGVQWQKEQTQTKLKTKTT